MGFLGCFRIFRDLNLTPFRHPRLSRPPPRPRIVVATCNHLVKATSCRPFASPSRRSFWWTSEVGPSTPAMTTGAPAAGPGGSYPRHCHGHGITATPGRGGAYWAALVSGRLWRGARSPRLGSPRAGPRTGRGLCWHTHLHAHVGTGRTVWRCERLSRSGRVCVCLCSRSLVCGAHGGARWCAYGLSLWACGGEARCAVFGCLLGRVFVRLFAACFVSVGGLQHIRTLIRTRPEHRSNAGEFDGARKIL